MFTLCLHLYYKLPTYHHRLCQQGLKATSSVVPIGFLAVESAANTFTEAQIDLNLSPLDREVFVVLSINLDPGAPDNVAGTNTSTTAALTSTSQTAMTDLSNANCLSQTKLSIRQDAASVTGVPLHVTRSKHQLLLLNTLGSLQQMTSL